MQAIIDLVDLMPGRVERRMVLPFAMIVPAEGA